MWATLADDYGLIPEIEFRTVLARARTGDANTVTQCVPRLVSALIDGKPSPVEAIEIVELVARSPWSVEDRLCLMEVLDAWWFDVLHRRPDEHLPRYGPGDVLGLLAHADAPMVRWLHPWLDEIDGLPATHLARLIVDGFPAPTWAGRSDEREQVMAWTRTETVINGLALIGTSHIDDDIMSRVLDILILGESEEEPMREPRGE